MTHDDINRALRAELELYLDSQPVWGHLRTDYGANKRFVGWLGFVAALKSLHEAPSTDQGPEWRDAPGRPGPEAGV